jgi:large subunit ribosomal protein L13
MVLNISAIESCAGVLIVQKTFYPTKDDITREWYVVDARGVTLGRLATRIASVLLGKNKPEFTPGVDVGDFVIVVNAGQVSVTGNKLIDKMYYRHSGYPGGLKKINLRDQLARFPERVVEAAVRGMLPHNRHGRKLMAKLKVYAEAEHPHQAQKPQVLELT